MNETWRLGDAIGGPIFPGMVSLTTISTAINGSSSANKFNQYRPIVPKNGFNTVSRSYNKTGTTTATTQAGSLVRPTRQSQQSTPNKSSTVSTITVNNNNNNKLTTTHRKRYSCDQCNYSTDRRDLYRRHENIHRDEKPFRCYVCNKMFNRADHVKKHFLRIHKGLEYNVKLIKRIKGVDYPPPLPTTTTTTTTGLNGDINGLPTFNLTLWNDESNRMLLNDFGHNQLNHHHNQQQQPPREPLGLNNGHFQSNNNNHRDVFNLIRDPCLSFCTKLSNQDDHPNQLNGHHDLLPKPSRNKSQQTLSPHKSSSSSSLLASSQSSLQSHLPSSSLLASPGINDSHKSSKELPSPQSSTQAPSSSPLPAVPKKASPPRIKQEPNHRPDSPMQTTSRVKQPVSQSTNSSLPSPSSSSSSTHSSPTVAKQLAKPYVNDQANRLSLDKLKKSSSILADYESLPFASLIFNTEPDPKKIDWFNRLNPVKVKTVSLINNDQQQPESSKLPSSSINITTDDYSSEGLTDADDVDQDETEEEEDDDDEEEELSSYPDCDGTNDLGSDHSLSPTIDQERFTYECEFCGCAFVNYPSLHTHRYLLHRYVTNEDNYYPYSCVVCGKRCTTQKHMIFHMSKHNETLKIYQLLQPSTMSIDRDQDAANDYSQAKARRKQPRPRKVFRSAVKLNHRLQQRTVLPCSRRFLSVTNRTINGRLRIGKTTSDGHSFEMTTDSEKEL